MKLFSKSVERTLLYHAYGLIVESPIELPELRPAAGTPNVTIRFGTVAKRPVELSPEGIGFWTEGGQCCHYHEGVGAFQVTGGVSIVVDTRDTGPDAAGVESLMRLAILGPVLGLALIQRGHFLLRGSAVEFGGEAVAFVGGDGVDTKLLAAALQAIGRPLVTDEFVPLIPAPGEALVMPSFPGTGIWDDWSEALGETIPRSPGSGKSGRPAAARVSDEPIPLRRVYTLEFGEGIEIEEMSSRDAGRLAMSEWYGTGFGEELYRAQDPSNHFRQCRELGESVRQLICPIDANFAAIAGQIQDLIRVDLALDD